MNNCPKCGKKDAAWENGFCGKCEEQYRSELLALARIKYKEWIRSLPDDTDQFMTFDKFCRDIGL